MKRLWLLCVCAGLLACGGGEAPESAAGTEQDLYKAIAAGNVRYALLTRSDKTVETQDANRGLAKFTGIEDMDALARVLSKEHIEYHLQELRVSEMSH